MTSRSMMGQKHYVLLYFKWVSDYTPKVNKTNNSLFCLQTQYAAHNLCAAGGAIKPVTLTSLKPFHLTQEKKNTWFQKQAISLWTQTSKPAINSDHWRNSCWNTNTTTTGISPYF